MPASAAYRDRGLLTPRAVMRGGRLGRRSGGRDRCQLRRRQFHAPAV